MRLGSRLLSKRWPFFVATRTTTEFESQGYRIQSNMRVRTSNEFLLFLKFYFYFKVFTSFSEIFFVYESVRNVRL